MEVKRVEGSTLTVDHAPTMTAGDVLRVGLAPTWSTVAQVAIGCLVVGVYVGAILMAWVLR